MRILLDECVDSRLVEHLQGLDVVTVVARGWGGVTNGRLLALAVVEFDVLITVDRNLSFQQHLPNHDIAVILLTARSNRIADLIPLVPRLREALPRATKRSITIIGP